MIYVDRSLKRAWKKAEYPRNIINFIIVSHARKDLTLDERGYNSMYVFALKTKEKMVIDCLWEHHLTQDQTAKKLSLSAGRVQQLEQRALHKLLNADLKYYSVPYENYKKALDTINYLRAYIEEHNTQIRLERFEKAAEEHEKLKIQVDDMGLTVRSRNCLRRSGIDTLGDIVNTSKDDMMRIRCLGPHSLEEITNKVHAYGYKMKWED